MCTAPLCIFLVVDFLVARNTPAPRSTQAPQHPDRHTSTGSLPDGHHQLRADKQRTSVFQSPTHRTAFEEGRVFKNRLAMELIDDSLPLAFRYDAILANIDSPECIFKGFGHKCAVKRGQN